MGTSQARNAVAPWFVLALAAFAGQGALGQDADALEEEEVATEAVEDEEEEAEGEDGQLVEEVLVTGSYIRRDNFNVPSPMVITTELDLEMAGTADLGDVIFDQTFQYGVNANATPFEGIGADDQQWNQGQEVWANLRGLGTRATMTMIDGHRLPADTNTWGRRAGVDINGTYPNIAIGQIETILDGASALYGAEAVGGVINLIPKKSYEGIEVSYDHSQAMESGAPVTNLSLIAGTKSDRGSVMFAMELRNQDRMRFTDRPDFIPSAGDPWLGNEWTPWWHDAGSRSNPGEFQVPVRDATGALQVVWWENPITGDHPVGHAATNRVRGVARLDPGCGYGFGAGRDDWGPSPTNAPGEDDPNRWPADMAGPGGGDYRRDNGVITYNDLSRHGNFLNGLIHPHVNVDRLGNPRPGRWTFSSGCIMSTSDMQDMQAESQNNKGMSYFEYRLNDNIKLRGEVVISNNDYNTRDVTSGLDEVEHGSLLHPQAPIVIGENPGNPFRAFADGSGLLGFTGIENTVLDWDDVNGDGIYNYGVEPGEAYLFAQDANGNGIPDRSWANDDDDGDGNVDADASAEGEIAAVVVLLPIDVDSDGDGIPDRFDADMVGNGGVRLFEDVQVRSQLNAHPKNPRNNNIDWAVNDNGILIYKRRFIRDNTRLRLGTEINIPNTEWIIDADYVWAKGKRVNNYPEPQLSDYVKALRCQGGPDGNSCWNPFSTQYLATNEDGQLIGEESNKFPEENDPGWTPPDAPEVNTETEVRNAGLIMTYDLQDLGMNLVDLVASTGRLFDLPYNDQPVGFAMGLHYRVESEEYKPSSPNQTGTGGGKRGLRESDQTTWAYFAEFRLPLLNHATWGEMELQLAARYAEVETRGIAGQEGSAVFDTLIPKIAFSWAPTEWLSVRSSMTEGFVTPGLYALFGTPGQFDASTGTGSRNAGTVNDYICDGLPELEDCAGANQGGGVPDVQVGSSPNSALGPETSDLINAGFSLKGADGDLVFDVDWTVVDFNGRVEQIGGSSNVASNADGFEDYVLQSCPGTVFDWDNVGRMERTPAELALIQQLALAEEPIEAYREIVGEAELNCRLNAALTWVNSVAKGGFGETGIGGSALIRDGGPNGLRLTTVDSPWVQQGRQRTETVIYALRYNFDSSDVPFLPEDFGSFTLNLSATQMLESSLTRYTATGCPDASRNEIGLCPGDNPRAGIKINGVGNRNGTSFAGPGEGLYSPLPPAPEFRANMTLRWFRNNHTMSFSGNWHDSITNKNIAWDEQRERGLLSASDATIAEEDRCSRQPSFVCEFESQMYWDLSYSYNKPDFMGLNWNVNVALRNVFDNYPTPKTMPAGYEGYLDRIMGRTAYVRFTIRL